VLPRERQRRIKELIRNHRSLRISKLSEMLGVSEMTIHRDLKPLIEEGVVRRTYGGVEWKQSTPSASLDCPLCGRTGDQRLTYRLILRDERVETTCCPHCGLLRHQQVEEEVVQAICQDFLTNTTVSADHAWYVFQPQVEIGCCQPQVLSFACKEVAQRFINGFGGSLHNHHSAMCRLHQPLNLLSSCNCSKGESPC
jgi:DNA-binding Lrp family transcriptional regulator